MILVSVSFLFGILYYIFSKENRAQSFTAFFLGSVLGVLACIVLAFFSFANLENSASVWLESARIYLIYYLIPFVIALPLFLLFSFSLSEETLYLSSSMLLGLLTVLFIGAIFTHRLEPESFKAEILFLSFFIAVFLYDLILKLFLSVFSFLSPVLAFLTASVLFLALCYPIGLLLAAYHFNNARFLTFTIAVVVLALVILPQKILSIFK